MRYRIGEVAELFSMTKEGVRYLERQGIIHSTRDGRNGYRYYPRREITRLKLIRSYQAIGFTIEEAERMLHETTRADMLEKLDEKVRELEKKEEQLTRMKQMLLNQRVAAHRVLTAKQPFDLQERPAYFLFPRVQDEASGQTAAEREVIARERRIEKMWIQAMPPVQLGALHYDAQGRELEDLFGCAATAQVVQEQQLPVPSSAVLLPPCLCAHGMAEGKAGRHPPVERMMEWIAAQGMKPVGDAFGLMQLTYRNGKGELLRLHELYIPVEKVNYPG